MPDPHEGPGEVAAGDAADHPTDATTEPTPALDADASPKPASALDADALAEPPSALTADALAPAVDTPVEVAADLAPDTPPDPEPPTPPPKRPPPPPAPRHHAAVRLIRPNGAVILLGLLCALAAIESISAFLEYRERIGEADWDEVATVLANQSSEATEPVIVASEWLGPSARMRLPQTRSWDALAYPDLRSFPRFWLLTHKRERPWRGPLRAELEGLPRPKLISVHDVGELSLQEYEQDIGTERFSLLESVHTITTAQGRCRGGTGTWDCKEGRVSLRTVEIDYRPRRCLVLELGDGVTAAINLGELELGDHIRGHVGFADFNSRLRADPTARLELWLDGAAAARWVFTDDQGWAAFALATPAGKHELELRVTSTVAGTWQRDGHRDTPTDSLCVELRGFEEGSATP
ncbi:hypothetical protein DB30_03805 [Enhygromyxa salina]|uniref:Uncharacterized protein n=1 Tax=Enhygromyxa salina TaxID=215803 RepID=A0A0C1ZP23_9BACT|nr:hypothetical protein [Enhygromyxa salina]KIG19249.1 hypothetical protein DB30_03805 [Enhygromyxa salina]